ncbi:uncharacterized WD repeat-containing protein alr2800-like [Mytilus californianus]|uniref:uncharacterized WD repeat-containing protein alr2800-like n=1 Tax=Mytilus californianus TaxID=6549 RepID=UPI0022453398|nr:uncharacterized WD repeat-containing protein alr2800-like [Mytilus californianus]
MIDSLPDPTLSSGIIEEESFKFDTTEAPANSSTHTPTRGLSFSQDPDISHETVHHRRDSGPHLEKFLKLINTIDCHTDVMCCKFTPDGSQLAIGLIDGVILVYNHIENQLLLRLRDEDIDNFHLPVTQIRFPVFPCIGAVEENKLLASYASGHIKLWNYTTGSCLNTMIENRQSLNVTYSPDGLRFVTTGETPELFVYDRTTRKKILTLEPSISTLSFSPIDTHQKLDGHCFRVFAAQYHPDEPHLFLSGGWDDTVHYWDDRKKHSIRSISGPHICGDAIDIDPIGKKAVLTGSWRRQCPLEVWDFDTGRKMKDIPSEPLCHCQLYCCQWLAKESVLCGGSDGNMAKVVNWFTLSTKGLLTDLPQGVYCIDNDKIGSRPLLAVGSKSRIYLIKPEKDF